MNVVQAPVLHHDEMFAGFAAQRADNFGALLQTGAAPFAAIAMSLKSQASSFH